MPVALLTSLETENLGLLSLSDWFVLLFKLKREIKLRPAICFLKDSRGLGYIIIPRFSSFPLYRYDSCLEDDRD